MYMMENILTEYMKNAVKYIHFTPYCSPKYQIKVF